MDYRNVKLEAEQLAKVHEEALKTIDKIRGNLSDKDKEVFDREMGKKLDEIPSIVEEIKPKIIEMIKAKMSK